VFKFEETTFRGNRSLRKIKKVVILSEAKNLSFFVFCLRVNRREILRFAQNDNSDIFALPVKPAAHDEVNSADVGQSENP